MKNQNVTVPRATAVLAIVAWMAAVPSMAPAQASAARGREPAALATATRAFLAAVDRGNLPAVAAFFPREGKFTYEHTHHTRDGDRAGRWRFAAADAQELIATGPLRNVFVDQVESQQVGLFGQQVAVRGTAWHQIGPARFAPGDAAADSRIFLEWRREGSRWVISRFGDESYSAEMPPPHWCC
jgi:hypothetical protein